MEEEEPMFYVHPHVRTLVWCKGLHDRDVWCRSTLCSETHFLLRIHRDHGIFVKRWGIALVSRYMRNATTHMT